MKLSTTVTLALLVTSSAAYAADYTIYVAPKRSGAYKVGKAKANGSTIFADKKLGKALSRGAQLLKSGNHTVTIRVAAAEMKGRIGGGTWSIPSVSNPQAELHILGGYDDTFRARTPLRTPTKLVTASGRGGPILTFGKRSQFKKVHISGFLFDAKPSNKYDARSNSLLPGTSRTYTLVAFQLMKIDSLRVTDCVFMNGAQGTISPYIVPLSNRSFVEFSNNFFINNRLATDTRGRTSRGKKLAALHIRGNSFLLNWPYNPDPTSSNVGTINLYHKDCCQKLNIEGNIFAFNPGGAMQQDWDFGRMPDTAIKNNLFYMNAMLFQRGESDAGVIVGKFGRNPKYMIVDLETLEDDFDYDSEGNVSFDPQVPLTFPDLVGVDSSNVRAKRTVGNAIRGLFGMNKQGGRVHIANYAPAVGWNLPLPKNPKAQKYGASPKRVKKAVLAKGVRRR